ncbi:cystatin-like [Arapaima gigas]
MTSALQILGVLVSCAILSASVPLSPGAMEDADQDDAELQACTDFALNIFNHFNRDPHLYIITKLTSAERGNVGGGLYDMKVEVSRTQCLKNDQVAKNSCQALMPPDDMVFHCHFVVLVAPWRKERILIKNSCIPAAKSGLEGQQVQRLIAKATRLVSGQQQALFFSSREERGSLPVSVVCLLSLLLSSSSSSSTSFSHCPYPVPLKEAGGTDQTCAAHGSLKTVFTRQERLNNCRKREQLGKQRQQQPWPRLRSPCDRSENSVSGSLPKG